MPELGEELSVTLRVEFIARDDDGAIVYREEFEVSAPRPPAVGDAIRHPRGLGEARVKRISPLLMQINSFKSYHRRAFVVLAETSQGAGGFLFVPEDDAQ